MKNLQEEEFMKIGAQCVDECIDNIKEHTKDVKVLLMVTMIGYDLIKLMRDKLFEGDEENEN